MPELPEVESVRRQLAPRLVGRVIEAVRFTPPERFPERFAGLETAVGCRVDALDRRGKYLIARLSPGEEAARRQKAGGDPNAPLDLVMHLGMTGSFRFRGEDGWQPDAYVRATFSLVDGAKRGAVLDYRDVRRFGRLCVVDAGEYAGIGTLAALGPEPLGEDFQPDRFHAALAASRMAVKPLLLTQRPVAGVGNIYADEALWRACINPRARRVGRQRAHALWAAIRDVLAEAIEREGTTFRDYRMVNGESGRNADFLAAYGQAGKPCPRCGLPLVRTVLAGRGTTYCPACQRR